MKELTISTTFKIYEQLSELPSAVFSLMESAVSARNNAYSPYSKFNVGAALLLENKEIITGSNQENASYPSGLCAERTAIYFAGAKYPEEKIIRMAISASSKIHTTITPIPPCGACRQTISEYENKQNHPIEIYFMGESGKVVRSNSLANLLPLGFDKSVL